MATPNETRLQLYLDAEVNILRGQSVRMGERYLQLADLEFVQREIRALTDAVRRERGGSGGRFSQADFSGCGGEGEFTRL